MIKKLILAVDKITTKITKPKNEWILESLNFFKSLIFLNRDFSLNEKFGERIRGVRGERVELVIKA